MHYLLKIALIIYIVILNIRKMCCTHFTITHVGPHIIYNGTWNCWCVRSFKGGLRNCKVSFKNYLATNRFENHFKGPYTQILCTFCIKSRYVILEECAKKIKRWREQIFFVYTKMDVKYFIPFGQCFKYLR